MKGQATVEYLILFAIGLALIGISVGALAAISEAEGQLTDLEKARIAAGALRGAGNEICALGDGNSRVVELAWEVSLECSGNLITASSGNQSAVSGLEHCDVSCSGKAGRVLVKNERGKIKMEEFYG